MTLLLMTTRYVSYDLLVSSFQIMIDILPKLSGGEQRIRTSNTRAPQARKKLLSWSLYETASITRLYLSPNSPYCAVYRLPQTPVVCLYAKDIVLNRGSLFKGWTLLILPPTGKKQRLIYDFCPYCFAIGTG